jgi:cystathionine beta-synthase
MFTQVGSIFAQPAALNKAGKGCPYQVEGIGHLFIPDVLTQEPGMIDTWVTTDDRDAFAAVQMLVRHEGALVGGSSGSTLAGALAWLRSGRESEIAQTPVKNVVIILPDGCV